MSRFSRMNEEGGSTGRGQGGGKFATDMTALAYAGNDNTTLTRKQ